jgi:FAD/FMN-containing dehydrogenase
MGGNVCTDAGGQNFLHGTVGGLEAVLPDGRVLNLNMNNNVDYDDGNGVVCWR